MAKTLSIIETKDLTGKEVELFGWVANRRDHGKIIFIDLRDYSGVVQVVFTPEQKDYELATHLRAEWVVKIIGMVNERPDNMVNPQIPTGKIEIEPSELTVLNESMTPPFPLETSGEEIYPEKFFALPQSPQQYKQLLMAAGFEKYFQIARCVRDEDLRADRGFEHTQIDLEMSFVEQKDVMALDEEMITTVVESMGYSIKEKPFPVFTHREAMEKFKADKFDLRTQEDKEKGILAFAWVKDFPFFEKDKEGNWTFTHNPFSQAQPEHVQWLLDGNHIDKILTTQYDLICNGIEVGGGSIRAHKPEMLEAVFRIMGYDITTIQKQFGHMLDAFRYGTPPHGGIAHGVERLIMSLIGENYLREVQAFPQTSSGRTSVMEAPSELSPKQLEELHIKVGK